MQTPLRSVPYRRRRARPRQGASTHGKTRTRPNSCRFEHQRHCRGRQRRCGERCGQSCPCSRRDFHHRRDGRCDGCSSTPMNKSGTPLTKPTISARRRYSGTLDPELTHDEKVIVLSVFEIENTQRPRFHFPRELRYVTFMPLRRRLYFWRLVCSVDCAALTWTMSRIAFS